MLKCSYTCHPCGRNMNYGTKHYCYLLFEVIASSLFSSLVLMADMCTKCEILYLFICITRVWVWLPRFKIGLREHCNPLLESLCFWCYPTHQLFEFVCLLGFVVSDFSLTLFLTFECFVFDLRLITWQCNWNLSWLILSDWAFWVAYDNCVWKNSISFL